MINNPNTTPTPGLFVARFIDLDLHRHAKDESRSACPESSVASSVPLFPVPCRSSRWLAGCNPHCLETPAFVPVTPLLPHVRVADEARVYSPRRTHASPMVFFIVSVGEKELLLGVRSAFTLTCEIVIAISKNVSS